VLTSPRPRFLALVGPFVAGILLGVVGAVVIQLRRTVGEVDVPWGLVLAVLGIGCCTRGAAWMLGSRRGAVAVLLGWLVPTLALSAINPGGDVVLTDEPLTYVYLIATFSLALLAASWPLPDGAAELAHPGGSDDPDPDPETDLLPTTVPTGETRSELE
jgi:hypothetical protein